MITVSDELAAIIPRGGFKRTYVADVVVDGERVLKDLELSTCELVSDGSAKIRNQGSAKVEYSDAVGRSIAPEDAESWFTPYATQLNISMRVASGDFSEKVLRGTYLVRTVSNPQASTSTYGGRKLTTGSSIELKLADAFRRVERERFPGPASPAGTTAWDEIGLLTGLPLLRNVADTAIPRDITYEESRLDALFTLGRLLDGIPYMTPAGQVAIQPDAWGSATEALAIGEGGTITRAAAANDLTDEDIYNEVVVRSHDDEQTVVLATARLTTGRLRYGGPFGRVPYFASSEFVTTVEQAQAYADALLPQVSTQRAVPYVIQCIPDPRREVGDVVPFTTEDGRQLVGRIEHVTLGNTGPMTLKVLVERE